MLRGGKLLSPEESLRLAIVDSVEREKIIDYYVAKLRRERPFDDPERLKLRGRSRKTKPPRKK